MGDLKKLLEERSTLQEVSHEYAAKASDKAFKASKFFNKHKIRAIRSFNKIDNMRKDTPSHVRSYVQANIRKLVNVNDLLQKAKKLELQGEKFKKYAISRLPKPKVDQGK